MATNVTAPSKTKPQPSKPSSGKTSQNKKESILSLGLIVFLINATLVGIVVLLMVWPKNTPKKQNIVKKASVTSAPKEKGATVPKVKATPTPILLSPDSYFDSYKARCDEKDYNFMLRRVLKLEDGEEVPLVSDDFKSDPKNPNNYLSSVKTLCRLISSSTSKLEKQEVSSISFTYKFTKTDNTSLSYPFNKYKNEWRFVVNLQ